MSAGTETFNSAISGGNGLFDVAKAGNGTFVYNPDTVLTSNQSLAVNAGTEIINGDISGPGYRLGKTGTGTLILNGANTYGGGTLVGAGTIQFGSGALPSSGQILLSSSATLNATGAYATASAWAASGKIDTNSSGTLLLMAPEAGTIDLSSFGSLDLAPAANLTVSGTIVPGPNGYLLGGANTLTLSATDALSTASPVIFGGSVTLTGSNSVSGTATVTSGTLTLGSTNGSLANADIVVNTGTTLAFDSSIASVTGTTRAKSVTLDGAALTVTGNSGANSVDAIANEITLDIGNAGIDTVSVTPNAAKNARLTASSLIRTNNGIVLLRGTMLGSNAIVSAVAGNANISLTTAPAVIGGGGALGSKNISIIPWVLGDTSAAGTTMSFVTYDAVNGVHPLDFSAEYDTNLIGGTVSDHNFLIPSNTTYVCNGATTVNSLWMQPVSVLTGSSPLTVTSGAIYSKYFTPNYIYKPIEFGTAEGVIGSASGANNAFHIYGGISGSGGLTVYANSGTASADAGVFVRSSCTYTGKTVILGCLNVNVDDVLPKGPRAGDVYVYGVLAFNQSAMTINGLYGSGRVVGAHTQGGKILTVGDNNANGDFSGDISQGGVRQQLAKIGAGRLVLSGTNSTFTGVTSIKAGILSVVSLNSSPGSPFARVGSSLGTPVSTDTTISLGSVTTNAQIAYAGPGETTDRAVNLAGTTGGGGIDASGTGPLVFTSDFQTSGAGSKTLTLQGSNMAANTIQGCISNNSAVNRTSLLKTGPGTWILAGTNIYTGPTTISNGTLAINGSIASATTVSDNGVLTGTGAIVTNNATALTVSAGGIVDPGSAGGIGTLSVTGNVLFAGGVLRVDASGANADLLAVSGSVTSALPVLVHANATGSGPWMILTNSASIIPNFTTDAPGYVVAKRYNNTAIVLERAGGTVFLVR